MIHLSEAAARHLERLVQESGDPAKGLRLFVENGGCAGMQYGMSLDLAQPEDQVFQEHGGRLIIDPESLGFLHGSMVDYCDDLTGTGFRIKNPNAVRSCGCGTSFEAAATTGTGDHG